jgi:hypothetical protein
MNNTFKKLTAAALVAALCIGLTACGGTEPHPIVTTTPATTAPAETTAPATVPAETTAPVETTVPETTAPVETTVPETTAPETVPVETVPETTAGDAPTLSGNWEDMQFMLDGVVFQLPMKLSDLEAAGWVVDLEGNEDYMLDANTKLIEYFSVKHPDYPGNFLETLTFYVMFWNPTDEARPLKECEINQVEIDLLSPMKKGNAYPEVVVGNGLKPGDTREKVEAVCGVDENIYYSESLGYYSMKYRVEDEEYFWRSYHLDLTVYEEYGITKIELQCY